MSQSDKLPQSPERFGAHERLREIARRHARQACNPTNALDKVSLQEQVRAEEVIFYALKEAAESSPSATSSFTPTHRHAEGGLYEVLNYPKVHVGHNTWSPGCRYRNSDGAEFVRLMDEFEARFKPIADGSDRTTEKP